MFLLPLVRPQRLLKKLARLPTHPTVLSALHGALPKGITQRMNLHKDQEGRVRIGTRKEKTHLGRYFYLPEECCALCFQRLERAAGVEVDVRPAIRTAPPSPPPPPPRVTIPNANPLHASKGLVARRRNRQKDGEAETPTAESSDAAQRAAARAAKLAERRAARQVRASAPAQPTETRPSLLAASPNGIRYLDALATTPYVTLPCVDHGHACVYCYYCIAEQLLSENMADELQDQGGWECLRCGEYVWGARRRDDVNAPELEAETATKMDADALLDAQVPNTPT